MPNTHLCVGKQRENHQKGHDNSACSMLLHSLQNLSVIYVLLSNDNVERQVLNARFSTPFDTGFFYMLIRL